MAGKKEYAGQCMAELKLGKMMSAFCIHEDGEGHRGEHKFNFSASSAVIRAANGICETCNGLGHIKLRCDVCDGTGKG